MLTITVMSIKEGSEHASAAPANALRTPKVAKLLQAACNIKKKPHRKILDIVRIPLARIGNENREAFGYLKPRYLPSGSRCIKKFVGNAQARKPK